MTGGSFNENWQAGDILSALEVKKIAPVNIDHQLKGASGADFTFSAISQNFVTLWLIVTARTTGAVTGTALQMQFNGDTGANYAFEQVFYGNTVATPAQTTGATFIDCGPVPGSTSPASAFGLADIKIANYTSLAMNKSVTANSGGRLTNASAGTRMQINGGIWHPTTPDNIDSIVLTLGTGNFDVDSSATLIGLRF